jgi:hypothetical protein
MNQRGRERGLSLHKMSRSVYRQALHSLLPELPVLTIGLESVFGGNGAVGGAVAVLDRRPNIYASTFPSEIVTCRFPDGGERRLLCKYAAGQSHDAYGHRGRVAYEVAVYRDVLEPLRTSAPRFYGAYTEAAGEMWLIVEYVDGGVRADEMPKPIAALQRAARWVGQFHADNEARLGASRMTFLNTYDGDYYCQWAGRTVEFAAEWRRRYSWLETLCERATGFAAALLAIPPTIIHGEFTPHNVLIRGEDVCPVDWESAAIAMGEIDLASLTDGWPERIARECEREYQRARWPAGPPADFERRLDLARLYWDLRWLGDRPEWTTNERALRKSRWRFKHLRSTGRRLGLI